jgi:hypothetical protein
MNVIDLFAQRFNHLIDIKRSDGIDIGRSLERITGAEKFEGIQYYLRGYSFDGVSGFDWFSPWPKVDIQMPGYLLWIASLRNYNLEYVLNSMTGEVTTFDSDYSNREWFCAVNYEAFFQSLLIVLDNEIEMAEKKTFDLPESTLMKRYLECLKINGNDQKFSQFYEHIIGVDLEAG